MKEMEENLLECKLEEVRQSMQGVNVILNPGNGNVVSIGVSAEQGQSIEYGRIGEEYIRPLTHELMVKLLNNLDVEMESVVLQKILGETLIAEVRFKTKDEELSYDARPSDGIALALRMDSKILIEEELANQLGVPADEMEKGPIQRRRTEQLPMESIDFVEGDDHGELVAELQNVEREEELEVSVFGNILKIIADTDNGYLQRLVSLPPEVSDELIGWSFKNGVLEVKLGVEEGVDWDEL